MATNSKKPDQPTNAALSGNMQGAPDKGHESRISQQDKKRRAGTTGGATPPPASAQDQA